MEKYLIYFENGEPGAITAIFAKDVEQAKYKYCLEHVLHDSLFLSYIYSDLGHELFKKDDKGEIYGRNAEGKWSLREDVTPEQAKIIFDNNVKQLFKNNPEYAELLLNWWYTDADKDPVYPETNHDITLQEEQVLWDKFISEMHEKWQFPEEMLLILLVASWPENRMIIPIAQ
ncbi:hypothetical protein [Adhaeribacter rhizoryzae]|uniref:Uncharacterized protein n=1 Tax=Adhaeribacter rhizoryzae TaxID=2607907 RepID=A0A5M6DKN2_9BACT|nr:hypothetical protein [Adhaeribacter rhizoryzae]KAA5548097.1 hypothetical protein F0145_05055 [Adhaeribacter rhizoryzae]